MKLSSISSSVLESRLGSVHDNLMLVVETEEALRPTGGVREAGVGCGTKNILVLMRI